MQRHSNIVAFVYVLIPIFLAVSINVVIFSLGWNANKSSISRSVKCDLLPPGYAIGGIWVFILGILGFVMYKLSLMDGAMLYIIVIGFLIGWCLAYPFLTSGLQTRGQLFNYISLLVSFVATITVASKNGNLVWWMIPLLVWVSYVNTVPYISKDCKQILDSM